MPSEISTEDIEKQLQGISIPPQPQIMVDLHMEQFRKDPDLGEIANLISHDVGLSGSVLKIINSASYGMGKPISSIKQAVMLLGMDKVIAIVNGLAIKVEMSDENIAFMNRFWDSAMDVAMTATQLSRELGLSTPESAYTLGLFHNCGIPLLYKRFDNYEAIASEAYTRQEGRLVDVENAAFKTNHAVVGYYIGKSWRVPDVICEVIAEHHNSLEQVQNHQDKNSEKVQLFCLLKMAENICCCHKAIGLQEHDYEWERNEDSILIHLGLSQYDYVNMKDQYKEAGLGGGNYDTVSDTNV
jgi:HD-like signal output (HDOD) protein